METVEYCRSFVGVTVVGSCLALVENRLLISSERVSDLLKVWLESSPRREGISTTGCPV